MIRKSACLLLSLPSTTAFWSTSNKLNFIHAILVTGRILRRLLGRKNSFSRTSTFRHGKKSVTVITRPNLLAAIAEEISVTNSYTTTLWVLRSWGRQVIIPCPWANIQAAYFCTKQRLMSLLSFKHFCNARVKCVETAYSFLRMGYFLLSVLWYDFTNKQTPFLPQQWLNALSSWINF